MATIILRDLDDDTMKAIKRKAKQEGVNRNTALVRLIREGLGFERTGECSGENKLSFLWVTP